MASKPRIIAKFGGASLQTDEQCATVARFLAKMSQEGKEVVLVPSARGDQTDELLARSRRMNPNATGATRDALINLGEQHSATDLAHYLEAAGATVVICNVFQLGLRTTGTYEAAMIRTVEHPEIITNALANNAIVIIPGFQGINETDGIVTLGRGGSDLSAVVIAAVVEGTCVFYKDVDGVFAVDPRIVPNARRFRQLTLEQMLLLAERGAGVLMARAVRVALAHRVTLNVRCSPSVAETHGGTSIVPGSSHTDFEGSGFSPIVALTIQQGLARLAVRDVPDERGQLARLDSAFRAFHVLNQLQDRGLDGKATVVYLLKQGDAEKVADVLRNDTGLAVDIESGLASLTLLNPGGDGATALETRSKALASVEVNIAMNLASSDLITTVVAETDLTKAANAMAQFFNLLEQTKRQ